MDVACAGYYCQEAVPSVKSPYAEPRAHALRDRYVRTFGGAEIQVPVESIADYAAVTALIFSGSTWIRSSSCQSSRRSTALGSARMYSRYVSPPPRTCAIRQGSSSTSGRTGRIRTPP